MCKVCDSIYLIDKIKSIIDYRKVYISYKNAILSILHENKILLLEESCPFDKTGAVGGSWYDDFMCHRFKCSNCGALFELVVETYHGNGYSKKVNVFCKNDYLPMKLLSDEDRKNLNYSLKNQFEDNLLEKIITLTTVNGNKEEVQKICKVAYEKSNESLLSDCYYNRIYATSIEYVYPR